MIFDDDFVIFRDDFVVFDDFFMRVHDFVMMLCDCSKMLWNSLMIQKHSWCFFMALAFFAFFFLFCCDCSWYLLHSPFGNIFKFNLIFSFNFLNFFQVFNFAGFSFFWFNRDWETRKSFFFKRLESITESFCGCIWTKTLRFWSLIANDETDLKTFSINLKNVSNFFFLHFSSFFFMIFHDTKSFGWWL